jgi:hypothetical protein
MGTLQNYSCTAKQVTNNDANDNMFFFLEYHGDQLGLIQAASLMHKILIFAKFR